MADTTFTNGVTLTDADWFNDVNRLHYTIFGDPSTALAAAQALKLHKQGSDVASASTIDLGAATGETVDVTGTTTITAITLAQGERRIVRFTGILTLTHGASLVLPGAASITTAAGDYAVFVGYASSVVRCVAYTKVDGTSVSTSAGFTTGDVKLTLKTTADTGWVLMDDTTIGDASSSATGRANADTSALFTLLWNNTADAQCAVSTGRGANAAADFAAHKTIALPKALGRALATYGAGSGLTSRAIALATGAETHSLTQAESALKSHQHRMQDGTSRFLGNDNTTGVADTGSIYYKPTYNNANNVQVEATGDSTVTAHNNMQPTLFLNTMIKL